VTRLDLLIARLGARAPLESTDRSRRQAAVAVLLTADSDQILLIRRVERAGDPWSGHIAFPGGKREDADVDLLATAIRETREETGVVLQRDWCRAQLDDLVPMTPTLPPVMVRPFVFVLAVPAVAATSVEVTHVGWTALSALAAKGVYRQGAVAIHGTARVVAGYDLAEGFLWGMTERILTPLLHAWKGAVPPV
jgi:8-oxo-dGTP pyrophosphatase MutT (NUDIX family)